MLKIVSVPNTILTTPTKSITSFDGSLQNLISEMKETLNAQTDPQGVGLAATQIGKDISLFIMKPKIKGEITAIVNPIILETSIERKKSKKSKIDPKTGEKKKIRKKTPLEGCLSIPRIWGPVKRAKKLLLQYNTPEGTLNTEWFDGFEAIIIQHEVDHLNGILFTQRALEQNTQLFEEKDGKLKKMEY